MNNNKPIISIIVPVYNVEKYLRQCLDSLVSQTMKDIEIICINDGSVDNSLKILNEYEEKDKRICIVNKKNSGVSDTRNSGLKIISGEYIMFVDSDDWVDTRICEILYKSATEENADCVMCSYTKEFENHSIVNHILEGEYIVWGEKAVKEQFHRRLFGLIDDELRKPQDGDIIVSSCAQLFNVRICKGIDFVDLKIIGTFEDGLYQIMVYQKCKKFVYVDKPLYHYRKINENSLTSTYNPFLFERWQNLYDTMQSIIEANKYDENYSEALINRICLSLIGLGLNEISAKDNSIFCMSKNLYKFLSTKRYRIAFSRLIFKCFPLKWKIFFMLCKFRMTFVLVLMLECIEFLRKRIR